MTSPICYYLETPVITRRSRCVAFRRNTVTNFSYCYRLILLCARTRRVDSRCVFTSCSIVSRLSLAWAATCSRTRYHCLAEHGGAAGSLPCERSADLDVWQRERASMITQSVYLACHLCASVHRSRGAQANRVTKDVYAYP